ncbi:sigma-70 family RNA polymerase sigma factor [Micromonospora sp. NPDC006431]|uniref:sigma-70 family RNA polymerase sigma factor n=1 Tax=Micromonospora sp. NPDC006431 TaxID=3364235 RepID=UPI0036C5FB45
MLPPACAEWLNRSINRWRWRARRPEQALGDHDRVARDHADGVALREVVVGALRALPARQRAAVVFRYLEDLPIADVAAAMGCSEGAVKSHAARGLARLREVLAESSLVMPITDSGSSR